MHHSTGQPSDPPPHPGSGRPTPQPTRDATLGSWPQIVAALRRAGEQAGANAADWWAQDTVGGRTTGDVTATARRVLAGIDDGDPAVLDALPACDLPDRWPGAPTGVDVYTETAPAGAPGWHTLDDRARTQVLDAYRDGYDTAVQDQVVRRCHHALPPPDSDTDPRDPAPPAS